MTNLANVIAKNWHGETVLIGWVREFVHMDRDFLYCALCCRTELMSTDAPLVVECTRTIEEAVTAIQQHYASCGIDRPTKPLPPNQENRS